MNALSMNAALLNTDDKAINPLLQKVGAPASAMFIITKKMMTTSLHTKFKHSVLQHLIGAVTTNVHISIFVHSNTRGILKALNRANQIVVRT